MNNNRSKRDRLAAVYRLDDEVEDWEVFGLKPTELLPDYVFLCTLLSQFRMPQVRSDFASGAFRLPRRSCDLSLLELDLLMDSLMPSWYGHDALSIKCDLYQARALFRMIISRQTGTMQLGHSKSMPLRTFADWYKILNNIANCPYWKEIRKLGQPGALPSVPKTSSTVQTNTEPVCTADANVGVEVVMQTDVCTSTECEPDCLDGHPSCDVREVSNICGEGKDENNNVDFPLSSELGYRQPISRSQKNVCDVLISNSTNVDPFTHPVAAEVCMSRARVDCSWCHRRGHQESSCWRKGGLCLICGGPHRMRQCSRYVTSIPLAKPICSSCSGDHLGKDCEGVRRQSIYCHWCGRRGHLEEACRVKSGDCLICGSSSHAFSACPEFVPRSVLPIFPPWCIKCGSHHIGAQCDSSYFE